jgi:hypothetical protein
MEEAPRSNRTANSVMRPPACRRSRAPSPRYRS